ncbi:hypothetical protein ABZP36_033185 [Zizania latifolia]
MSIALESGPGLCGGRLFGRITRCAYAASPPAPAGRSSSPVGRDSDSPAASARWEWDGEEVEGGDGEVQSSYKEPFDTMDALQEALPFRKGVSKFYNGKGKSGSCAKLLDSVTPSPLEKGLPKPEKTFPRKRKGLLPFSFKWGKP